MSKANRWLAIFGAIIGLVLVVAVVLTLVLSHDSPLLPENTPEGTLQRFILAIRDRDQSTAEKYLSSRILALSGEYLWRDYGYDYRSPAWQAILGKTNITNGEATIVVNIDTLNSGAPLSSSVYSRSIMVTLIRENGTWKIDRPEYLWNMFP